MDDYMQKGYVRKLSPEELREPKDRIWYLPIFPVFNPNKPNKVRIVWDAAATVGGVSFNSVLMKGPDLLTALPFVLYRFRERPIAVSGDIAEMFLRMLMNPLDQHCQRIFWCNRDGTTGEYVVTVMTFGAKCSPSCAQFIINENAARFAVQFPEAVEIIKKGHYVDDMLVSVDTEEEAIKLAKDIHYIHLQGGFTMRNWISNSPSVVQALGETGTAEKSLDVNNEAVLEKVLGMWWDTKTDTFRYKLSTERNQELISGLKHPTKRDVLRVMMSVYDPLGLISHYMVYLKLLFQEIWREGSSWDDEIGVRQLMKWKNWLQLLPEAESIAGDFLRPENYSNLSHLQRLTALVQRFPVNLQRKLKGEKLLRGPLTSEELLAADNYLYKRAQWACYQDEMATLSAGKPNLPKTSSLFKVSPFIDNAGVMRIRSRIDVCDFADEKTQFPIVLPRRNPLTNLVLQNVHEKYHHQCNETFVNEARKKFNIPRVTVGRRSEKRYGVLVTCLTTRAIHIEIAHSLSTDSCIMALRNCFSRRGTPLQIISDRGTNFVGASKELMEALANVDNNKIMAEFTTASTSWSFNPPASPHMGGIWERMIQTVKKVLAEIKPKRLPTDEVLKNLMAEIENVVNSRPLTHVPVDDESSPALTPNHFLVGSSNGSVVALINQSPYHLATL
ncbi:uncharacterized protein LOC135707112 [Ochlerotatus camptorhynchus]|uniref:uncharacterized protein LOC135707112 n=1 Tax=Ochlerotatus camptorhynchus TaxID=644619 RepID=UPI0031DEA501